MSAFMVDKVHLDLLVSVALDGPSGRPVNPGNAWNRPSWPDVEFSELESEPFELVGAHFRHLDRCDIAYGGAKGFTPDMLGQMLMSENLASIHYRYPDTISQPEGTPGPVAQYWTEPYAFASPGYRLTAVEALSALACYEYQSCEHPGWRTSEAFRFCDALRQALIHHLPGMNEAPWGWSERHLAERRVMA